MEKMALDKVFVKKLLDYLGFFPNMGGGCLLNWQNKFKLTNTFQGWVLSVLQYWQEYKMQENCAGDKLRAKQSRAGQTY